MRKRHPILPLIVLMLAALSLEGCSDGRGNSDLYVLEEYEAAAAVDDYDGKIERLNIFVENNRRHPFRMLAYKRIMETMAVEGGDRDGAFAYCDKLMKTETDPYIRSMLLYAKFNLLWDSDRDAAVKLAREICGSGETGYLAYLYLGYYLMYEEDDGNRELARECLEKAGEYAPDDYVRSHVNTVLGELLDMEGKKEEALAVLEKASGYPFADEILGRYHLEKGERREAIESYIRFVAGVPGGREEVRLDSLYALEYPGSTDLDQKIAAVRLFEGDILPDREFMDIKGGSHSLKEYRGECLVISAWSPT